MQRLFRYRTLIVSDFIAATLLICSLLSAQIVKEYISGIQWPEVKVVDPGPPGGPPQDAIVLFDGKDMSQWIGGDNWIVKDGYVISNKSDIRTKQVFGDYQLHVEWATPEKIKGSGQQRGNSGVYLMS